MYLLLIRRGSLVSFYSGLLLECRAVTSHLATHRRPGPELRATTLTNTLYTGRVEVEGDQVRQSVLPLLLSQILLSHPLYGLILLFLCYLLILAQILLLLYNIQQLFIHKPTLYPQVSLCVTVPPEYSSLTSYRATLGHKVDKGANESSR